MVKKSLRFSSGGIYSLVVVIYIFFRECGLILLLGNINVLFLVFSVFLFGLCLLSLSFSRGPLRIWRDDTMLLLFAFYVVLDGITRTQYPSEAFEYWALLLSIIAFKLVLQNGTKALRSFIGMSGGAAVITTSAVLLQGIFPSLVSVIQRIWFSPSAFQTAQTAYGKGYCTGLTAFPAAAVWYCFILLSIFVGRVFTRKSFDAITSIGVAISCLAMLFTQKRSVLAGAVIAFYIMFIVFSKRKSLKLFRMFLISVLLILILIWAYEYIPQVQYMWGKTNRTGNALSGRIYYWEILLSMFKASPIFGVGGGTCTRLFGFGGHNCYLQLLAEYGIVGLALFLAGFGAPLCGSIYRAKRYLDENRYSEQAGWLITSIMIQAVFFIYCFTGNPLFDHIFFMTEISCTAISQSILQGNFD